MDEGILPLLSPEIEATLEAELIAAAAITTQSKLDQSVPTTRFQQWKKRRDKQTQSINRVKTLLSILEQAVTMLKISTGPDKYVTHAVDLIRATNHDLLEVLSDHATWLTLSSRLRERVKYLSLEASSQLQQVEQKDYLKEKKVTGSDK